MKRCLVCNCGEVKVVGGIDEARDTVETLDICDECGTCEGPWEESCDE